MAAMVRQLVREGRLNSLFWGLDGDVMWACVIVRPVLKQYPISYVPLTMPVALFVFKAGSIVLF